MKFTRKIPATDTKLSKSLLKEGWHKLKEPSNLTFATILSLPFMLINTIIYFAIIFYLHQPFRDFWNSKEVGFTINISLVPILLMLLGTLLLLIIHELIHAAFIPDVLKSTKTFWGFNGLFGFVYSTEKINKWRFILISIMPFILLSILLPFILNLFGWLNPYTIIICLINAAGSSVDSLNIFLVITQVPNRSKTIMNGMETYYISS